MCGPWNEPYLHNRHSRKSLISSWFLQCMVSFNTRGPSPGSCGPRPRLHSLSARWDLPGGCSSWVSVMFILNPCLCAHTMLKSIKWLQTKSSLKVLKPASLVSFGEGNFKHFCVHLCVNMSQKHILFRGFPYRFLRSFDTELWISLDRESQKE